MPSREQTAAIVIGFFALVGIVWGVNINLVRAEHIECQKWLGQEQEIAKWYSTDWQKAQCKQFGINFSK